MKLGLDNLEELVFRQQAGLTSLLRKGYKLCKA